AVVDGGLRQLAGIVAEAGAPDRNETLDVRLVDLAERAVLIEIIAHPEGRDVLGILAVSISSCAVCAVAQPHQETSSSTSSFFMIFLRAHMPIIARSSPCPICVVVAGSMRACANVAKGGGAVKPAVGLYLARSSLQEDVAIAVVVLGIDHVQRASLPGLEEHL